MFDGTLEILNATRNDEGLYTCFAENDRGKANSSGYLTITGVWMFYVEWKGNLNLKVSLNKLNDV